MDREDLVIIFEGNAFEVMQLTELLQEKNITVHSNEDISGGLTPDQKAQLIVPESQEEEACSIINPVIIAWASTASDEPESVEDHTVNGEATSEAFEPPLPYKTGVGKFILFYFLSPYLFLFYYIIRQLKYLKYKTDEVRRMPSVFLIALAGIFQSLSFFLLYNLVYKVKGKNSEIDSMKVIIYPLASFSFFLLAAKISSIVFLVFYILSMVPLIPFVREVNSLEESEEKTSFLTVAEIIILFVGVGVNASVIWLMLK